MKSRFPLWRRMMLATSMVAHLLMFAAFLCLAMDLTKAMLAIVALAMLLLVFMPPLPALATGGGTGRNGFSFWSGHIAMVLLLMWLVGMPEIHHLLDRMITDRTLLDPKVLAAVALWMAGSATTQWRMIRGLSDQRIFDWLDRGDLRGQGNP